MTIVFKDSKEEFLPIADMCAQKVFYRDYETGDLLLDCKKLSDYSAEIYHVLMEQPDKFFDLAKKGLIDNFKTFKDLDLPKNFINFRLINYLNKLSISEVKIDNLGKLFIIKGIIKRVSKKVKRIYKRDFSCGKCGSVISVPQDRKEIERPKGCSCGNRIKFRCVEEHSYMIRELMLEDLPEEITLRQANQIRAVLEKDLAQPPFSNKVQPGKRVEIVCIVKPLLPFLTLKDKEENITDFFCDIKYLTILDESDEVKITDEDLNNIKEIAKNNPLEILSNSLAPEVYGSQIIKKAIILQMLKGVEKTKLDNTTTKSSINVLIVGEPGTGKTALVKSALKRTPNGRLINSANVSKVGLGAMVEKDELTGQWGLEYGSFVLSSGSIIGLDELDKMDEEVMKQLYEPMGSETLSVDKAIMKTTLVAKTGVLANANPVHGNFDLNKSIASQIKLPSPILNRFDLIFIMVDKIDEEFDRRAIRHILDTNKQKINSEISIDLFKKYIFYAKELRPELTKDAEKKIEDFYIELRRMSHKKDVNSIPVNLRNIEGVLRLAEANAKLRLSKFVEEQDLEIAKNIFLYCLSQIGLDKESGVFDLSRMSEKVPVSKRGKLESLFYIINNLSKETNNLIPFFKIKEKAEYHSIPLYEIGDYLEQLKKEGKVYEPKSSFYALL